MDLDDLLKKAQDAVEDRGGTDALKTDALEVKEAMTGEGSIKERATEAMEAVKDPGAPGAEPAEPAAPAKPAEAPKPA